MAVFRLNRFLAERLREEQYDVRCEDVTRPGTRIVASRRCWTRGREVEDEEQLAAELEQVRRDQDELERRQRDIEEQRRRGFGGF